MTNSINNLDSKRHTLAHLTAQAVRQIYPEAKNAIGPTVENGWYQDFDLGEVKLSDTDLAIIEEKIIENLNSWTEFTKKEVTSDEALKEFAWNEYKTELINDFSKEAKTLTFYTCGGFLDLCKGGHCEHPSKEILPGSFKLDKIAGAYWKGDANNKMLTRIYGSAFDTKEELDKYIWQQEEAKKRDHRILGKKLEIFHFSDLIGPGLPLWLPNGAIMVEEMEKLAKENEEINGGYKRVRSPHITKEQLFITSGHLPYYADSMYPAMEYDGSKYYMKPMNCPFHHEIFNATPKTYRDLPIRYAEHGTVYRHEDSGSLFGLMRVRAMCQNDAHIYCTEEQFEAEFDAVNQMYLKYFKMFGIEKYVMRLSLHSKQELGKKYVNEPDLWIKTEDMVRKTFKKLNIPYVEVEDEAAFYGPKIDIQIWSVIGREFTLATNQVDFAVPKRFNVEYVDRDGTKKTPLCIHRAPLSTHERFIGFLIEHFAGAFPVWLSPVQVSIVPVKADLHNEFANKVYTALKEKGVRVELDDRNESLGKRIRAAKEMKTPYVIVIGDKERDSGNLTVETRADKIEGITIADFVAKVEQEIKDRTLN